MMLRGGGWGETSLPVAFQTVESRRTPWGCAAGAPYRGTASPLPPPQVENHYVLLQVGPGAKCVGVQKSPKNLVHKMRQRLTRFLAADRICIAYV